MKASLMKWAILAVAVAWSGETLSGAAEPRGAVSATHAAGDAAITMENDDVRLVVDPLRGGAVVSYVVKANGRDIVPRGRKAVGLFTDHFWGQSWPGELFEVPYDYTVLSAGPEVAMVKVWRTVRGNWGGRQAMLEGLVIEKIYTLRAGEAALSCRVAVRNPTAATRLQAYWIQHLFWIGGDYDAATDVYFRPSTRGVIATAQTGQNTREDFVRDPLAGWSAAVDTVKGDGLVFLLNYHDLEMLYDCGGNTTLEWMYDKIPVPAGRAWESEILLVPTTNMTSFAHASPHLLAGVSLRRQGASATLTHTLRATAAVLEEVTLTTRVIGAGDRKEALLPPLEVGRLTLAPQTATQHATALSDDPLVALVTATGRRDGEPFREEYFYFHAGGYGYGANVQQDLVTPLYRLPRPEKRQELMRPEKIARLRQPKPQLFAMRGLHHDSFGVDEAARRLEANLAGGDFSIGTEGPRITDFPFDYDTLMRQDVLIVANASLESLGQLGQLIMRDYLTHGGSLLLLGGKSAFGNGGLAGAGLAELLPVELAETRFDIRRLPGRRLTAPRPHPAVAGLDWAALPAADYYLHTVKVRPAGTLLLAAGEDPFLVVGELPGGGRVACLLAAPYGGEDGQPPACFAAPGWPEFMRNLLAWLSGRDAQKVGGP